MIKEHIDIIVRALKVARTKARASLLCVQSEQIKEMFKEEISEYDTVLNILEPEDISKVKVVINRGSGSLNLPQETMKLLVDRGWSVSDCDKETYEPLDRTVDIILTVGGVYVFNYSKIQCYEDSPYFRTHKDLIDIFENELSPELSEQYPKLEIVEIPENIEFYIDSNNEHSGFETVHEKHRVW